MENQIERIWQGCCTTCAEPLHKLCNISAQLVQHVCTICTSRWTVSFGHCV